MNLKDQYIDVLLYNVTQIQRFLRACEVKKYFYFPLLRYYIVVAEPELLNEDGLSTH